MGIICCDFVISKYNILFYIIVPKYSTYTCPALNVTSVFRIGIITESKPIFTAVLIYYAIDAV